MNNHFKNTNKTLAALFTEFWYLKPDSLKIRNDSRTLENFKKKLNDYSDTDEIDISVIESHNNKETLRKISVAFYDYLKTKYHIEIASPLYKMKAFDYPFERQLEIAKFLHTPRTNKEILEEFNIGARTLRQDIETLRDGIEILGTTIQISEEKIGQKKFYKSTLHPIFLPLNLTEAYALTVYMPNVLHRNNGNAAIIKYLSDIIKTQLSDYAQERLFGKVMSESEKKSINYRNDETLARSRDGILTYLEKSGVNCTFYHNGVKKYGHMEYDHKADKYFVITDTEKIPYTNDNEIDFVINDLKYL